MGRLMISSALAVGLAMVSSVGIVQASTLAGQTVTVDLSTDLGSYGAQDVVVGAGDDGNYFNDTFFDLNAGVDGDIFTLSSSADFCGIDLCDPSNIVTWTLTGLDFGTPITGFEMLSSIGGATATFTATSVTISYADVGIPVGLYLEGRFITDPSPVPLPAGLSLIATGIGALVALRKRRKAA